MKTITTVREMQTEARLARLEGRTLALVPTMGALHEGHLALVREARRVADHVTVSLFVNPTQFGPREDFSRYPRDLGGDVEKLEATGAVDVLFTPNAEEMYPFGTEERVWVHAEGLDRHLCGPHRPGHFKGVTTVVAKLLNICQPDRAVFGLKDAQQFLIVRRMVKALHLPVELVAMPTLREEDGLAMSSRNAYLSAEEREQAVVLSAALEEARARIAEGEQHARGLVQAMLRRIATASLARVQYAEVVDLGTLQPVGALKPGQKLLVALAVFFGTTRLIDNTIVSVPEAPAPSA